MYSRSGSSYGQQNYGGHSGYSQTLGNMYTPNSDGASDLGGGLASSRNSSMLGVAGSYEPGASSYRAHVIPSASQYGGQYGSVYSSAHGAVSQVPNLSAKSGVGATMEGRGLYSSNVSESPKFVPGDYGLSSNYGYTRKSDSLYAEKVPEYTPVDRSQYNERKNYSRDMQSELASEPTLSHQHQPSMMRQDQLLKSRPLQSSTMDSSARQVEYLSSRGVTMRHLPQQLVSYEGKGDPDPHSSSLSNTSPYVAHHPPSILGAVPRRTADNLLPSQPVANPGYGISLPPGRDYGLGKGVHVPSYEPEYRGVLHTNERCDDYLWDIELREEDRRREIFRERERVRENEMERDRERERERDWERNRERERLRMRKREKPERVLEWRGKERKRPMEVRQERTPARASRDRRGASSFKNGRLAKPISPARGALHRRHSSPKEKRREYSCKVYLPNLVAVERDYLSTDRRYSRLCVSSDFTKVIIGWPSKELSFSINNPVRFEHGISEETLAEGKDLNCVSSCKSSTLIEHRHTVYNSKVILMSGLPKNFDDLSSEMSSSDRVYHICSVLKFSVIEKENTLMAIGGPWVPSDGRDPSLNESSLIQSAIRHAKDIANVDLRKCRNWNPFLEIHYDRFGDDGFFSHKEVTVLFVPDLSECLPSLDTWKKQFAAHKTIVIATEQKVVQKEKPPSNDEPEEKCSVVEDSSVAPSTMSTQNGKKKIIRRIVNQKVTDKDNEKEMEALTGEDNEKIISEDISVENVEAAAGSKTTVKKKIVKRVLKRKIANSQASNEAKDETKNIVPENSCQATEEKLQMGDDKNVDSVSVSVSVDTEEQMNSLIDEGISIIPEKENNEVPTFSPSAVPENTNYDDSSDHAGLILQIKRDDSTKSVTVSLESLLEYTEKDTAESTFELSLFAESFYEMLQYQMGAQIFSFLRKVRASFVTKRNERRKQREEAEKSQCTKRLKIEEVGKKAEEGSGSPVRVPDDVAGGGEVEEEKECYNDAEQKSGKSNEGSENALELEAGDEKGEAVFDHENALELEAGDEKGGAVVDRENALELEAGDEKGEAVVDRELLRAFRFFDRNQAGYIRAEDMKQIIHSLGKCLCHRDVKELVQSALFLSNTGRDDRILYSNLLRMAF